MPKTPRQNKIQKYKSSKISNKKRTLSVDSVETARYEDVIVDNEEQKCENKKASRISKNIKYIKLNRHKSTKELCHEIENMLRLKYPPENRASLSEKQQIYILRVSNYIQYYSDVKNRPKVKQEKARMKMQLNFFLQSLSEQ